MTRRDARGRVIPAEHRIYPLALRWLAEGKLKIVRRTLRRSAGASDIDAVLISPISDIA